MYWVLHGEDRVVCSSGCNLSFSWAGLDLADYGSSFVKAFGPGSVYDVSRDVQPIQGGWQNRSMIRYSKGCLLFDTTIIPAGLFFFSVNVFHINLPSLQLYKRFGEL